jgi:hypothetical protein
LIAEKDDKIILMLFIIFFTLAFGILTSQYRLNNGNRRKSMFITPLQYNEMDENSLVPFQYDSNEIDKYYSRRPFEVWERLIDIGSPIIGWWIVRKYDSIMSKFRSEEENRYYLNQRASDLKDAIVQGKSVTFIKSGQALALRQDLVKSPE